MRKKLIIYIIIFVITMLITYLALPVSHALDSYCTMCNGYKETAIWFLKNGRVFSYLFYIIFGFINLPYNYLGIISVIIGNMILSYTILKLYLEIEKYLKSDNKYIKYILLLSLVLLFYNQLYVSILLLDECFIIDLGLLFMTLSSIKFIKGGLKNYLLSLLFLILGVACYQGIVSYFIVIIFLFMIIKNNNKIDIKSYLKTISLIILFYGISFVSNFIIIKLVGFILKDTISKIGTFNIIDNLKIIFTKLLPTSMSYLFGFINTKYYYFIAIILFVICLFYIIKNKNRINNLIILCLILFSAILTPFIPNIFMNTKINYIDARMALTLGTIPTLLILYIILSFKISKKSIYVLGAITVLIFGLSSYRINQNLKIDLRRYYTDIKYVDELKESIRNYELDTKINIDTIYYTYDKDSAYYYNFGFPNGANIRLLAVDWAMECVFKRYIDKNIVVSKMDDDMKQLLFNDNEYDEYNAEELVFDNNILYLLIF